MKRISKFLCCLFSLVFMCVLLTGCKDNSYAGLHVQNNANVIYDICKTDADFTITYATDIAKRLATYDFKEIKHNDEYVGGIQRKVIITDTNDLSFIIILQDNKFVGVCAADGSQIYTRSF